MLDLTDSINIFVGICNLRYRYKNIYKLLLCFSFQYELCRRNDVLDLAVDILPHIIITDFFVKYHYLESDRSNQGHERYSGEFCCGTVYHPVQSGRNLQMNHRAAHSGSAFPQYFPMVQTI